uniref:Uncharacterized protein n=1 Tax=Anguilla anguilla TaxID=7936 RepID=A0A0E9X1X3_ANGAN
MLRIDIVKNFSWSLTDCKELWGGTLSGFCTGCKIMQLLTVLQNKAILAGLHTCSMPNLPKRTFLFYPSDLMSSAYTMGNLFWFLAAGKSNAQC